MLQGCTAKKNQVNEAKKSDAGKCSFHNLAQRVFHG